MKDSFMFIKMPVGINRLMAPPDQWKRATYRLLIVSGLSVLVALLSGTAVAAAAVGSPPAQGSGASIPERLTALESLIVELQHQNAQQQMIIQQMQAALQAADARQQAADAALRVALEAESAEREKADAQEAAAREAGDAAETSAREAGDAALYDSFFDIFIELRSDFDAEIATRQDKDAELAQAMDDFAAQVDEMIGIISSATARIDGLTEADAVLQAQIDSLFGGFIVLPTLFDAEASARSEADAQLKAEFDAQVAEIIAVMSKATADTSAGQAADTDLQGQIDALSAQVSAGFESVWAKLAECDLLKAALMTNLTSPGGDGNSSP